MFNSVSRTLTVLFLLGLALASGACATMTASENLSEATTTANDHPAASPGFMNPSAPEPMQAP